MDGEMVFKTDLNQYCSPKIFLFVLGSKIKRTTYNVLPNNTNSFFKIQYKDKWGVVVQWAYSSIISLLRRQGSRDRIPVVPLYFIRLWGHPVMLQQQDKLFSGDEMTEDPENAGAAKRRRRRTSRRFRNEAIRRRKMVRMKKSD